MVFIDDDSYRHIFVLPLSQNLEIRRFLVEKMPGREVKPQRS